MIKSPILPSDVSPYNPTFPPLSATVGFGGKHRTELTGITGSGNGAKLAEPLLDPGVGERCANFLVMEIDDLSQAVARQDVVSGVFLAARSAHIANQPRGRLRCDIYVFCHLM
jgi:hypothetical protein